MKHKETSNNSEDSKIVILKHQSLRTISREAVSKGPKQLTKQVEKLSLRRLLFSLLLAFSGSGFAQVPDVWMEPVKSVYLEIPDSNCTRLYDYTDSIVPAGYTLHEKWTAVGTDTFEGFWNQYAFFIPSRSIYLVFWDCGVTFEFLPALTMPAHQDSRWNHFLYGKSQSTATWTRIAGYGLMALGGYLGSEGERQRVINGLDSPAFHTNRDLSLACAFSAGASFTLSWGKTPNLKWWEPVLDATLGSVLWYAVSQRNWESYK